MIHYKSYIVYKYIYAYLVGGCFLGIIQTGPPLSSPLLRLLGRAKTQLCDGFIWDALVWMDYEHFRFRVNTQIYEDIIIRIYTHSTYLQQHVTGEDTRVEGIDGLVLLQ
jgi:hypothetical protein